MLEAMHFLTPVIAAHNSSLTEVGGDAATFYASTNAEELCEKMLGIDQMDLRLYKHKAKAQSETFSWKLYAQQIFNHLEELVEISDN